LPTERSIREATYALARPLFFYLNRSPEGQLADFVEWTLSREGQSIVTKAGYYPIREAEVHRDRARGAMQTQNAREDGDGG
jgi:phosphate transport system substrate-binding protein